MSQPRWRRGHQWQCSEAEGLEIGIQEKYMAHEHHAKSLPSELNAPLLLNRWRRRAMVVGAIFAVLSIVLAVLAATVDHDGIDHLLRSYLLGLHHLLGLHRGRPGAAHGAVSERRQVGLAGSPSAGGDVALPAPGHRPVSAHRLLHEEAVPVGAVQQPRGGFPPASDHPRAGARDRLQASHAEHPQRVDSVRGLLCDLVRLHALAQQVGTAARCRPASQRALLAGQAWRTSAASASWSTPSP